jgi:hypothetical protein
MDRQVWFGVLLTTLVTRACIGQSYQVAPEVRAFLAKHAAVTEAELAGLQAGQPIAKLLPSHENREVVVFGTIRIDVPLRFFLDQSRDIEHFKASPLVPQIGKFSDPPSVADLARLTIDGEDLMALSKCKSGVCPVKASLEMMQDFRQQASHTPFSAQEANAAWRKMLARYVENYSARGGPALVVYADKAGSVNLNVEFQSLLAESSFLHEYAPQLEQELTGFPSSQSPRVEGFLYWSKENYAPKSLVSITHMLIYPVQRQGASWCFIASKQIYASHYSEGSLGTTILAEGATESGQPFVWVMYMNRSRVDALRGWFVPLKRFVLTGRARTGMAQNLGLLKTRLEQQYRQKPHD